MVLPRALHVGILANAGTDISESGALSRVYENTGAEAERLLEGRVRIVKYEPSQWYSD